MGNDGAVKVRRKDLVRLQKFTTSREDGLDQREFDSNKERWTMCFLSNRNLSEPIVSDYKGNLYNKEAILELLLDPESMSMKQRQLVSHITSLKDVVELKISKNGKGEYVCPITGDVLGANKDKYVYLVKCHDVLSDKSLKEISSNDTKCPLCNQEYDLQDVIVINPTLPEDIQRQEQRHSDLKAKGQTHSLSKSKNKSKKRKQTSNGDDTKALKKPK